MEGWASETDPETRPETSMSSEGLLPDTGKSPEAAERINEFIYFALSTAFWLSLFAGTLFLLQRFVAPRLFTDPAAQILALLFLMGSLIAAVLILTLPNRKESASVTAANPYVQTDQVVCPHCLTEQAAGNHFYAKCQTPLSSLSTIDPLGYTWAMGDTFRKATHTSKAIVVAGLWILLFPQVLFSLFLASGVATELKEDFLSSSLAILFLLSVAGLYIAILYKTTKSYFAAKA